MIGLIALDPCPLEQARKLESSSQIQYGDSFPLRVSLGLLANSCTFSPVGESHTHPLLVSLNYSSKYATPKNTSAVCKDEIIPSTFR